jgi:NAD-dependent deacetylase
MALINNAHLRDKIRNAQNVAVLTGAGISAESGIPTFRGENGIWNKLSPQELASFEAFYRNAAMVVEWYRQRRQIINNASPNPGHRALVEIEKLFPHFTLITQNIDGLHQRAGSHNTIELHGNIMENYCIRCGRHFNITEFDHIIDTSFDHVPRCDCGGLIRPNVVWFGEMLPQEALEHAFRAAEKSDLFISVGTSAQVRPAADLPFLAHENGAMLIEINTELTPLTPLVEAFFQGPAGIILPQLHQEMQEIRQAA